MKRASFSVLLFALAAPRLAHADTGPPRRLECGVLKGGEPCWFDGEHAGACVEGLCRVGVAPAPRPAPPPAPPHTGPRPCQLSAGAAGGELWLAAALSLVGLAALGRRRCRR